MKKRRLTSEAVEKLTHPKNLAVKEMLAVTLGVHLNTITRKLNTNEWNGDLTKLSAIEVIERELRMPKENVLETELIETEA